MTRGVSASHSRRGFSEQVWRLVRQIPAGRVMTYGGVAALVPPPRGMDPVAYRRICARWVGYAMADAPDDVPWQRVVNARGGTSLREGFGPDLQRALLESEGIRLTPDGCVDLERYGWRPEGRS